MFAAGKFSFFFPFLLPANSSPLPLAAHLCLRSYPLDRPYLRRDTDGKKIVLTLSLSLFLSLGIPDKDPIDALPTCNHALSVCLRGKPCSQIYEDFKSNCKAREGKCRMESRWVKTLHHHYHSLFYFRRSRGCGEPSRKRGMPPTPIRRRAVSPRVNIYVCSLLSRQKCFSPFRREAYALSSLFIIQVKGNSGRGGCSFWMSIKEINFFAFEFPSFRLSASRPTGYSTTTFHFKHRVEGNLPPPLFLFFCQPTHSNLMLLSLSHLGFLFLEIRNWDGERKEEREGRWFFFFQRM